jgi:hypothetical protein
VGFFPVAKVRNGARLVEAARLCLVAALDGGIRLTGYEDWTRSVAADLSKIVARIEEDAAKLPPSPYHEDDREDDPAEVKPYGEARDELISDAHVGWDAVARARQKLEILLADERSGERFPFVDKAYELLGMAERLFVLAGDPKTAHETPKL